MIKTISRTQDTILVVDDTGVKTARADHPKWAEINEVFNAISYHGDTFTGPTEQLLAFMDMKTAVETYTVGMLSVTPAGVTYAGRPLHTIDADRLMAFMRDKLSYKPIANYIARKMKNPSARAIKEMYNFLEHKGMPLTIRGTFLAYKGVKMDFYSVRGNKETVVLQGKVNEEGQILNEIGAVIEVERSSVDDDFRQGCSFGLHAGSLAYAKGWGPRVVIVEIDPADVVSVPDDCGCQKLRCCKYTVVGEYSGPLPDTVCTDFETEGSETGVVETETCGNCGCDMADCTCTDSECETCGNSDCEGCSGDNDKHHAVRCDGNCGDINCPDKQRTNEAWLYQEMKREEAVPLPHHGPAPESAPIPNAEGEAPDAKYQETYDRVAQIIYEQLGVSLSNIKPNTRIDSEELAMDSLDGVELTMALEEEFGREISDEEAERYSHCTIDMIVKAIMSALNPVAASAPNPNLLYNQGLNAGKADKASGRDAKWIAGDEKGADSEAHENYICGYVVGYGM